MKSMLPILVVLLLVMTLHAQGQIVAGSLSGAIRDAEAAVISDATVTVKNLSTGRTFTAMTDARGRFRFAVLAVGDYTVNVLKANYQTVVIERYSVTLGAKDFVGIEMKAATEFAQTITISGEAPLIETSKTTVDTVITNEIIDSLPLFERDFLDVLTTLGGVVENNENGLQSDPGLNIGGARTRQNVFQIDGGSNTSSFDGKRQQFYNLDVIEEVQLSTAALGAQYGRGSGGVVNVVTKSGTNDLAGSFSYFLRDSDLNENSRNEWQYQEFSFLLGGPVIKDKLFFLLNASRVQREDIRDYVLAEYSDLFPNDTVTDDFHRNAFFGKLTWYASDSQTLNASVNYEPFSDERMAAFSLNPVRDGFTVENGGFATNLNHTWNISESMYTQTFLNIRNIDNSIRRTNEDDPAVVDIWSLQTRQGSSRSMIQAAIGPLQVGSTNEEFGISFSENLNFFAGETAWGSHSFTTGFSFDYASLDAFEEPYTLYINFPGPIPPETLRVVREKQFGDPEFSFDHQNISLFGQDVWQVNDRVTLNLGARVDYDSFLGNTDLSPRIGLAVDPTGKQRTVIKAGASIYYAANFFQLHRSSKAPVAVSAVDFTFSENFDNGPQFIDDRENIVRDGLKTPRTIEANIGLQHQLTGDLTMNADFVWREMEDQFYTIYDNLPLEDRIGPRPDPTRGTVIRVDNIGFANYRAFTLGLNKRFSDRWMLNANYTWSRARGNASRFQEDLFTSAIFRTQKVQDEWVNGEGPLSYDLSHQFKITGIYMFPWDITVSAFYVYRSGYPFSVYEDIALGPIPINTERLPDYKQLDMRLYKAFRFSERYKLAFYADFINVLNTENIIALDPFQSRFGVPNPDYLQPISERSFGMERETQLGVKFEF